MALADPAAAQAPPEALTEIRRLCSGLAQRIDEQLYACSWLIAHGGLAGRDLAQALRYRGDTHRRLGRLELALADYDRSLALRPRDVPTLGARAETRERAGDPAGALADHAAALAIQPASLAILTARGTLRWRQGDVGGAAEDIGAVLDLDPAWPSARLVRGMLALARGAPRDALPDFAAAAQYGTPGALAGICIARHRLGERGAPLREACIDALYRAGPDGAWTVMAVAAVALQLGDRREAGKLLEDALRLEPGLPEALRIRAQLRGPGHAEDLAEARRRLPDVDRRMAAVFGEALLR
jgi:tetratricopeptide (TPR) repeat protein